MYINPKRLTQVHSDPLYMSVWQLFMIHGGDYSNGPKYDKQQAALSEALKPFEEPDAKGERLTTEQAADRILEVLKEHDEKEQS